MAFSPFADSLRVKTIDSGEMVDLGSFEANENLEAGHYHIQIYKHGTLAGTEQARVNIYSSSDRTGLVFQSSWVTLSDIPSLGTNWLGWVRFDFSREFLNKNSTYYPSLELSGYTRNGDTFYLGIPLDWRGDGYGNAGSFSPRFEVYGYT